MNAVTGSVFTFLVGASVGSFLNVCISRWPKDLSIISPRSRCPSCEHAIAWYDNLPLLSWLILRGKCRHCGTPISPMYPLVELSVALWWLAQYLVFGPTLITLRIAVFGTLLLGIAVTDARHYLIPDGFTVFGLVWIFAIALVGWVTGDTQFFASPYESIIGACAGAGAITIIGWLGEVALKKEAMGFGDATLMAVVGAALGAGRSLLTIFVGAVLGASTFLFVVYPVMWLRSRRRGTTFEPPLVPFGVFLAPAAMVTLLWGYRAFSWYLHLVRAH
jgi:leader peptidase (prepilin peptidase) / N-methyltransferase